MSRFVALPKPAPFQTTTATTTTTTTGQIPTCIDRDAIPLFFHQAVRSAFTRKAPGTAADVFQRQPELMVQGGPKNLFISGVITSICRGYNPNPFIIVHL